MEIPDGGGELALSTWDILEGHTKPSGKVLICDATGAHGGLSVADMLSAAGHDVSFATLDRYAGRAIGGQNHPTYLRNLHAAGVTIMTDVALTGIRRENDRLVARIRHAFGRDITEISADTVIVDHGTEPLRELFNAMAPMSSNFGELDHDAFVELQPQPLANPDGRFALLRIGDVLATRDIHAAIFEANRLARCL
tara:strand:+ start:1880 stop:2467 length:588 start_codon:yes stop_codon:yes gene_type:complete